MSRFRRVIIPLLIVIVLLAAFQAMRGRGTTAPQHAYQGGGGSFTSQLNSGDVQAVLVNTTAQTIQVKPTSGPTYTITYPDATLLA